MKSTIRISEKVTQLSTALAAIVLVCIIFGVDNNIVFSVLNTTSTLMGFMPIVRFVEKMNRRLKK